MTTPEAPVRPWTRTYAAGGGSCMWLAAREGPIAAGIAGSAIQARRSSASHREEDGDLVPGRDDLLLPVMQCLAVAHDDDA